MVVLTGMSGRQDRGRRGECHDGGVDVHSLARTPPAKFAIHGRRPVRDAVSGPAAQHVPVRVLGGQRGHALLALALRVPARGRRFRVVHRSRSERTGRAPRLIRRGRARDRRHRLATRAGHP